MGTFALRSSTTASALRAASADTLRLRTFTAGWHLYLDGIDAITRADITTWRITDGGSDATGRLDVDHLDLTNAYPISPGAIIEAVDGTASAVYWSGVTGSREIHPINPGGRMTRLTAVDLGRTLDTSFIASDTTPAGEDRAAIQYLVATYGRLVRAPDSTVALTNTATPAISITNQTLRQALRAIAEAAGSTSRFLYVDVQGRLNYGVSAIAPAPYAITDSAPNGTTTISAADEPVTIDYDEDGIVNAVWATGTETAAGVYGEWVTDATSIETYGRREGWLTNEAIVDSSSAQLYGGAYLAKLKDPPTRGSFSVTGYDGWAAGQAVTITDAAQGLTGAVYEIAQVETIFIDGTGRRTYRISFGDLPRSLAREVAAKIGG